MTDWRDDAGLRRIAPTPHNSTDPASTAGQERILLLECRLEQLRSQLESARAEADLARTRLADAAAREADHARRYTAALQQLAEARAEIASLHRQLEHSEALRAELEGRLFEPGTREDAEELVRLRRELLVERHRANANERTAARLRERVEELQTSRETILSHLAEWQELVRRDGPEAVDLARYMSDLRREILELESRNTLAERREAVFRKRLAMAGIDPDEAAAELLDGAQDPAPPPNADHDGLAAPAQEPVLRLDESWLDALPQYELPVHELPAHELPLESSTAGARDDGEFGDDVEAADSAGEWRGDVDAAADDAEADVDAAADHEEAASDIAADHEEAGIGVVANHEEPGIDAVMDQEAIDAAADQEAGIDAVLDHEEAGVDVVADHEDAEIDAVTDHEEAGAAADILHLPAPLVQRDALAAEPAADQSWADVAPDPAADQPRAELEPDPMADQPRADADLEPAAAPEPGAAPGATHALVAALESADLDTLRLELRRCIRVCGEDAVLDAIRPWTGSPDAAVRAAAYEALGLLLARNAAALEPFMRAGLHDPDGRVRRRVVLAAAAAHGLPLRSLLEPVRVDRDPRVRRVVLEVLRHVPPAAGGERRRADGPGVLSAAGPAA